MGFHVGADGGLEGEGEELGEVSEGGWAESVVGEEDGVEGECWVKGPLKDPETRASHGVPRLCELGVRCALALGRIQGMKGLRLSTSLSLMLVLLLQIYKSFWI